MLDEILTLQEVADYLKVSRTTVWRWCQQGKLAAFKAGRGWRVRRVDVERMTGVKMSPVATIETQASSAIDFAEAQETVNLVSPS